MGSLLVRGAAAVLPAFNSAGVSGRAASQASFGLLLAFFRAAIASLRRFSSGSFGQFGAALASLAAGGGRSSFGGTTSGERSRYSMPGFSMHLATRADIRLSMSFSSKVM